MSGSVVMGIDPGGTTGLVVGKWVGGRFEVLFMGERAFRSVGLEYEYWVELFGSWRPNFVYCETFSLRTAVTSGDVLSPVVVRTIVECALVSVLSEGSLQCLWGGKSPSVAKSYCTDERLRRWGYWIAGSPHVRDAVRQVLVHKPK